MSAAKIFLTYSSSDNPVAKTLSGRLQEFGHTILTDWATLQPGQEWRQALRDGLREANVFVALITETSRNSQWIISELGTATGYAELNKKVLVLPVLWKTTAIPAFIEHIQCIKSPDGNFEAVAQQIDKAINVFLGQLAAREEAQDQTLRRIEANAPAFIEEAITSLARLELRNRWMGSVWYAIGFLALAIGLLLLVRQIDGSGTGTTWVVFAHVALKSLIGIGVMAALAKYAFSLGKSFTSEALKASDRVHAISFGRFYLRVYGHAATWPDIKDAFAHWNIDRRSAFADLDPQSIDPQVIAVLIEAAKSITTIKENKTKV